MKYMQIDCRYSPHNKKIRRLRWPKTVGIYGKYDSDPSGTYFLLNYLGSSLGQFGLL